MKSLLVMATLLTSSFAGASDRIVIFCNEGENGYTRISFPANTDFEKEGYKDTSKIWRTIKYNDSISRQQPTKMRVAQNTFSLRFEKLDENEVYRFPKEAFQNPRVFTGSHTFTDSDQWDPAKTPTVCRFE